MPPRPEPGDSGPQHAPRKRRRWPLRITVAVLATVLIAAGGIGAYAYQATRSATDNLSRTDLMPGDNSSAGTPQWEDVTPGGGASGGSTGNSRGGSKGQGSGSGQNGGSGGGQGTGSSGGSSQGDGSGPTDRSGKQGALNVVLMGSDSRQADLDGGGRSDTLMLLHLDADRRSAYLISFPRDMYVPIPGHGMNKINAAYSWGGPQLTIQTLQNMLAIQIDHAAMVSFDGFVNLTDEVGGVTVTNDHAFSAAGYTFPEGQISLSGKKALTFVRARYQLPNGDLDRAKNQRKVVEAILAKGLSGDTIANPGKFNAFVAGVAGNLTVDQKMTDAKIRKLALSLRMNPKDINQLQAPLTGYATVDGVGSVDVVDQERLRDLGKALRTDSVDAYRQGG